MTDATSNRVTTVELTVRLSHPLWAGDGKDEDIAVESLERILRDGLAGGDTYTIQTVDTDE